jgi:hypothetical protein
MTLMMTGCGGSDGPGAGKVRRNVVVTVTYQGAPVTSGQLDFQNLETGEAGGGEIDGTGKSTISNLPVGTYTVSIVPSPVIVVPDVANAPTEQESTSIPQKYRSASTSPLKAEVTEKDYRLAFELEAD